MLERFRKRAVYLLRKMNPPQIIVLMFLAVILTGASILTLPASSAAGTPTDFLTCLFTATSATCVTGLSVVETGLHWSIFGQWMILLMIQIGGLGFMSIACVFYIVLRRRIGLKKRMILAQALSLDSMNGVVRMVRNVVLGTLAVELCGAARGVEAKDHADADRYGKRDQHGRNGEARRNRPSGPKLAHNARVGGKERKTPGQQIANHDT